MALPVIDIKPWLEADAASLRSPGPEQLAVSKQLHDASSHPGFFYLTGHGLQPQVDELLELTADFFARPQAEKDAIRIENQDSARGYQHLLKNVTQGVEDLHEGLDFYREWPAHLVDRDVPLHGVNQWPKHPAAFKPKLEAYIERCLHLGNIVTRAIAVGLGCDNDETDALLELVDESFYVVRALHYPPLPPESTSLSVGAHADYGLLTFLYGSPEAKGSLEVFVDRKWHGVDMKEGAFVVNLGEMFGVLSNGLYTPTLHRVVHRHPHDRYSIPFFFEASWSAEIAPLDAAIRLQESQLKPGETLQRKQSVVYGDFLTKKVGGNFLKSTTRY